MAFRTYQCDQYKQYLQKHSKTLTEIYDLINDSPFTYTQLGEVLSYDYYGFKRRLNLQKFTTEELTKLLDFIK